MTRLLALAAFLLASSAAQAQYSFQFGDRTIRIDYTRCKAWFAAGGLNVIGIHQENR